MIRTFHNEETARVFRREGLTRFAKPLRKSALRKLLMLHAAASLDDLSRLPGNRLEKLEGTRAGQYSIRINDQWRICFRWVAGNAFDVQIVDYH